MTTYVLILTLMSAHGNGNALATIPGFSNVEGCRAAGTEWLTHIPVLPREYPPYFRCVVVK
jgi:hypothetical protein